MWDCPCNMTLPTRILGERSISAISLGCMNLSHAYGTRPSEADAVALLNRALDLGVTMLDTAALYGAGDNERLLAKAVLHRRHDYMLASKCVLESIDGERLLDGSPAAITGSVERSLARLGCDHIDLLYMHRLDRNVPIEDSVGALVRLKDAGKIGAIGLSEMSGATIRRAHAVHPIAAVQSEYSPMVRNVEVAVLETCRELNIALVAFSPVARGLLAGAIHNDAYELGDIRAAMPRFVEPQLSHNLALVSAFEAIAGEAGVTPAQLALAWVLSRGPHVVALPGTRSVAHLEENLATLQRPIDASLLARVDGLFPIDAMRGPRYVAALQAQVDTELLPGEVLA